VELSRPRRGGEHTGRGVPNSSAVQANEFVEIVRGWKEV